MRCPSIYRVPIRGARLTVLGFVLFRELTPRAPPRMHFLFVRSEVCRRLPSDSTSRWTPLPLANGWNGHPPFRTFTLKHTPMPGARARVAMSLATNWGLALAGQGDRVFAFRQLERWPKFIHEWTRTLSDLTG